MKKSSSSIIGAHLSIANGYAGAVDKAKNIGARALQIFSTSPRSWTPATVSPESIEAYLKARKNAAIDTVFFHASYLINLADDETTGERSVNALIHELKLQPKLHVLGSVVHIGSYKLGKKPGLFDEDLKEQKYQIVLKNLRNVLRNTPENSTILIENDATKKVCQRLETIARIIQDLGSARIQVCLDTCHLHAAGYDLKSEASFENFLTTFDHLIGLDLLRLIHLNDSKDDFASGRDRHENLGKGQVGTSVFANLLTHPKTRSIPFILEVPGFDGKGPDSENISIANQFAHI